MDQSINAHMYRPQTHTLHPIELDQSINAHMYRPQTHTLYPIELDQSCSNVTLIMPGSETLLTLLTGIMVHTRNNHNNCVIYSDDNKLSR